jgi:Na+/melibiose symporter-like transporter
MNTVAITRRQLTHYGFFAVPIAFAGFPLYVLVPDFYATHQNVSLAALGIILLILRAFDAVQDPFIGRLSDRFAGKVFPVMAVCALGLIISIYALFHPMGTHPVLWFSVWMALAVTVYSILSINLNTLGALWTNNKNDQTRISTTREAFGLLGLLLAVSLPGILGKFLPVDQVFLWFSVVLGGLVILALLGFRGWFRDHRSLFDRKPAHQASLWQTLLTLPKQTHHLFLVYGLSVLASSIPAILVIFFIRDRLNAFDYTGLFLFLYFLSGALAMPLWKRLSLKYGKHRAWLLSMVLAVVSFVWAFFLGQGDVWQYAVICITSGIALGGDLALPPSILGDHIHESTSDASAATQFSILVLLTKAGLAIGSAIVFPLLDIAGFIPNTENNPSALLSLSFAYAVVPCLIKLTGVYVLYHFFIQTKGHYHEKLLETHVNDGNDPYV